MLYQMPPSALQGLGFVPRVLGPHERRREGGSQVGDVDDCVRTGSVVGAVQEQQHTKGVGGIDRSNIASPGQRKVDGRLGLWLESIISNTICNGSHETNQNG